MRHQCLVEGLLDREVSPHCLATLAPTRPAPAACNVSGENANAPRSGLFSTPSGAHGVVSAARACRANGGSPMCPWPQAALFPA
eukprot:1304532-Alexandrium_andersonii.AAC.1